MTLRGRTKSEREKASARCFSFGGDNTSFGRENKPYARRTGTKIVEGVQASSLHPVGRKPEASATLKAPEKHLAATDPRFAALIAQARPFDLVTSSLVRPFDSLAESIAYQQLSGKAAATIFGRVRALYPKRKWLDPELMLKTPDETLRACGLSRSKTAALKDLAAKTLDGTVPTRQALLRMTDEEIIQRLTSVRGIGRWTVEMLLLFELGRLDVWPVADYGVRKGFAKIFGRRKLPTPKQLSRLGEKFRPYRSVAAWYFWRALEKIEKLEG
jgi:3-methyladenine DNA glycosylase/8-oxoguanine DNA glycosylase